MKTSPKTYLGQQNDKLRYNESIIGGIKHEQRSVDDNNEDEFYFEQCEQIDFIHTLGTVYLFGDYGYVCSGYTWYRFLMADLQVLSN